MSADKPGFISLKALREGPPDPQRALGKIREIYFKTTPRTIEHDLAHAIELLKSMPGEEDREKARVYMDGLSQMRSEWERRRGVASGKSRRSGKVKKVSSK
jgi:hypothetical protein